MQTPNDVPRTERMNEPQQWVKLAELAASLEQLRQVLPKMIEMNQLTARVKRENYMALIEAGFDEKQALELCTRLY